MENCNHCNSSYDPTKVQIPTPIPDGMCAFCGTQLTPEQIQALVQERQQSKGA